MPNWACGFTDVTGTKQAISSFLNRFIYPDEPETADGVRYFARSFLRQDRSELQPELDEIFKGVPEDEECEMRIFPDFAWSASTCVESGYPEQFPDTCITLSEACIEDQVDVVIHTKEEGMWFEEEISCDRDGSMYSESASLKCARCVDCGNTQGFASFEDLDELECCECDGCNFEIDESEEG